MKLCTLFLLVIICFPIPMSAQSEDSDHPLFREPRPGGTQSARARVIIAKIQTRIAR
jgi:hypothetical protein